VGKLSHGKTNRKNSEYQLGDSLQYRSSHEFDLSSREDDIYMGFDFSLRVLACKQCWRFRVVFRRQVVHCALCDKICDIHV